MGCKEECCSERMSGLLLIRAVTESPKPGVGGHQATSWPAQPDRRFSRDLPVWAQTENVKAEERNLSQTVCQLQANGCYIAGVCG